MLIVLVGNNEMYRLILPKIPSGKYKITSNDGEHQLLEINSVNGKWQMRSTNIIKIMNSEYLKSKGNQVTITDLDNDIVSSLVMEKNTYIRIYNDELKKLFVLFCLPEYSDNWKHLDIKEKQTISIGSTNNNTICYAADMVQPNHARISFINGKWTLENLDDQIGTFLNSNSLMDEKKVLSNGDNIFLMGLQIIIMQDSLYINQPFGQLLLNQNLLQEHQPLVQKLIQDLDEEELPTQELYKLSDYFEISPRIEENLALEPMEIAPPPARLEKDNMPLILTVGSTVGMGLISIFSFSSTIISVISGAQTLAESAFSILSSVIMLFAMLFLPFVSLRWQKKREKEYEKNRQEKYSEYIKTKVQEINKIKAEEKQILNQNYAKTEECISIIQSRDKRFWKRTVRDTDFLTVNLGNGTVEYFIGEPKDYKEEFSLEEDDNLINAAEELNKNLNTIEDAPVTFSLQKQKIAAIVDKDEVNLDKFMKNLFIQLMAYQSYNQLKLVFLLDKDNLKKWEYVKMFPYVWNDEKDLRFFEDNRENMGEISSYLEAEYNERKRTIEKDKGIKAPFYLIITDNYRKISNLKIISLINESDKNLGFSILCVANDIKKIPKECDTFVTLDGSEGALFHSLEVEKETKFKFDNTKIYFLENVVKTIANIPIKSEKKGKADLPSSYSFLEMYNVGQIEQLNILDRWKNNDPTISLAAPVGINAAGDLIDLNIHEKAAGPHGLIAGSTGSGKSEFIITYILSMAINYHPDDVRFILIDYKGGGLAGVFNKKDYKLPHLVGTITNIDKDGLERSILSIESEMKRRQVIFNKAREISDGGVIDIYKYRKLYQAGIVDEPVPHLLIICDEFAELKQQQPDFMESLISISRIGRSLGVHLILATQKPSGIVDEQIRSNSKFSVCLKVQDTGDSKDVIDTTDAAFLKQSGRFYIKVGTSDYYELGQSGWSGEVYQPSDNTKAKIDDSIKFISNNGSIIKELNEYTKKVVESKGDQLTNIIKEICDIAENENIKPANLWLDDIPENIYLSAIKEKYDVKTKDNDIVVTVGEYDDPANQSQGVVNLSLTRDGNLAVFGNAESGKESLISTIIYDLISSYTTEEVWTYILDFGTEALKIFKDAPQVGEVIFTKDAEKLNRFFKRLKEITEERRQILSEFNGDYYYYLRTTKKTMPLIVIVLNGYDTFIENYTDVYDELLLVLTREGINLGINFIVTTNSVNDFRYRIAQNFKQRVALSLNERDEYGFIFTNGIVKPPPQRFGRGLVNLKEQIYEMQICKIAKPEEFNIIVPKEIERQKNINTSNAENIPILPEIVKIKDLDVKHSSLENFPIGMRKRDIKPETFNFNSPYSIISGKSVEDIAQYVELLIHAMSLLNNVNILLIDGERKIAREKQDLNNSYTKLQKALEDDSKKTVCFILGVGKFINFLSTVKDDSKEKDEDEDEDVDNDEEDYDDYDDYDEESADTKFENIMNKASKNLSFIIADTEQRIREQAGNDWYSNNIISDNIIWIGNGIDDQFLLDNTGSRKEIDNQCGPCFGYISRKDRISLVKLLEMKEKKDDDE